MINTMTKQKQIIRIEIIEVPERFYFKVSAAAKYIGLCPNTVRTYTDLGRIKAKRLPSGDRLYSRDALDEFFEKLPDALEGSKKSVVFTYNHSQSDLSSNPRKEVGNGS